MAMQQNGKTEAFHHEYKRQKKLDHFYKLGVFADGPYKAHKAQDFANFVNHLKKENPNLLNETIIKDSMEFFYDYATNGEHSFHGNKKVPVDDTKVGYVFVQDDDGYKVYGSLMGCNYKSEDDLTIGQKYQYKGILLCSGPEHLTENGVIELPREGYEDAFSKCRYGCFEPYLEREIPEAKVWQPSELEEGDWELPADIWAGPYIFVKGIPSLVSTFCPYTFEWDNYYRDYISIDKYNPSYEDEYLIAKCCQEAFEEAVDNVDFITALFIDDNGRLNGIILGDGNEYIVPEEEPTVFTFERTKIEEKLLLEAFSNDFEIAKERFNDKDEREMEA